MRAFNLTFRNSWDSSGPFHVVAVGSSLAPALKAAEAYLEVCKGKMGAARFFLKELSDLGTVVVGK